MEAELTFRIILKHSPVGVDFGLQKGQGGKYETIQKQRSGAKDLPFTFTVTTKKDKEGNPDFRGPVVQGAVGGRFVYIDIGTYAGQTGTEWARRLKVPLRGLTWAIIKQSAADPSLVFEIQIEGTAKDGGPTCGTVKPFDGWKLVHQ